jgi:hypothetical protein
MPASAALLVSVLLAANPFAIEVVDSETGRGVPLVELTTTGGISYVTDSAGLVAFDEPGLMDQRVHFLVQSHGYEMPADGFGIRGIALDTKPGGSATIKVRRTNIAERLYRMTGQGIYRDSLLLAREAPIREPVLNAQVIGSDSVMTAEYRSRLHWFWGDTNQPKYPLGNFHTPGATSLLPGAEGWDASRRIDLSYYTGENGFARPTCQMPGEGPTWINGVAVLPDASGRERMLCGYAKIKGSLSVYRRGIAIWNDETESFERVADFEPDVPMYPDGHTLRHRDGDTDYLYFGTSTPLVRVKATVESYCDLAEYEAYTCLAAGTQVDDGRIDRDEAGQVRYAWKKHTPPVGTADQAKLVRRGMLKANEGLVQLRATATGKPLLAHHNSCAAWNPYRKRWTNVILELGGASMLGEIWYAEADSPLGPWVYATKIVSHDKYSFYNPRQHVNFAPAGSSQLYFEGTYTHTFSGNETRTPRYDYNQIMYRVDLDDPRLALPAAVYDCGEAGKASDLSPAGKPAATKTEAARYDQIAFFALDRPQPGAVALVSDGDRLFLPGERRGEQEAAGETIVGYVLPADEKQPGATVPLYAYTAESGPTRYDVHDDLQLAGYRRAEKPVCRVWPSPYRP